VPPWPGWILANNSDRLRRGDVVPRLPIDLVIGLEVFRDQLLAFGQTIAATHLPLLRTNSNLMIPRTPEIDPLQAALESAAGAAKRVKRAGQKGNANAC
jgi:hypothetical protein